MFNSSVCVSAYDVIVVGGVPIGVVGISTIVLCSAMRFEHLFIL